MRTAVTATGRTSLSVAGVTAAALDLVSGWRRGVLSETAARPVRREAAGFPASAGVLIFAKIPVPVSRREVSRPTGHAIPLLCLLKTASGRPRTTAGAARIEPDCTAAECRTLRNLLPDAAGTVNAGAWLSLDCG
jgi:hypothetical protein